MSNWDIRDRLREIAVEDIESQPAYFDGEYTTVEVLCDHLDWVILTALGKLPGYSPWERP